VDGTRRNLLSVLLFGFMVLAWAGNYLFVREGEQFVSPLWLATFRAATGVAGVAALAVLRPPQGRFGGRDRRDALLLGIPNTAVFLGLWFVAAPAVPPGQTAVIVYTFPLWVALLSPGVLGGRLGAAHWAAVGLGFAGVVLVSQPWVTGSRHVPFDQLGELLGAAVSWAGATVLFQRRFAPEALGQANLYQLLGGAVVLGLASLVITGPPHVVPSPDLWISVAWLGLFGTAFAYGVWFFLLRSVHASSLSAYAFLVPLIAIALSVGLEHEQLSAIQVVGAGLVLLGVYLVGRSPLALPASVPRPR
jgi:drug/metabolite transporter (DMT)-like permease